MKTASLVLVAIVVAAGLVTPAFAQQPADHPAAPPLVQLLQSKGIISADEAAQLSQAGSAEEMNERLGQLLVQKGLITPEDYGRTVAASATPTTINGASGGNFVNTVVRVPTRYPSVPGGVGGVGYAEAVPNEGPAVIPAVTPVRVLPIDTPKQGGLVPDIKLGSGAAMKLYGFFKASAIEDRASSGGPTFGADDFPLPLLLADTGPNSDPQFHIKARSFRIGSQFEWVPKNSDVVITGRLETDFEGDYTNVNNRNVSSVRNSQLSVRLAYARIDGHMGSLPVFAEFGQDWTLLASSTMPALFETTQLGAFFGNIYERAPQFKIGANFGRGSFHVAPEFAILLPVAASSTLTDEQRARFGDRAGAESNRPAVEGRVVFQFPLHSSWRAVAPAQIIFSGHHATLTEIVPAGSIPATVIPGAAGNACPVAPCTVRSFYPTGVSLDVPNNIWTAEIQLPTPFVTIAAKYHRGADLRYFFGGETNDFYTTLSGATQIPVVATGTLPGEITAPITAFTGKQISFGCTGGSTVTIPGEFSCPGTPVVVSSLQPIRGQGGWVEASFPLSRIFHADPEGHNSGWILHFYAGTDQAVARDVIHPAGTGGTGGNSLLRTDYDSGSLTYRMNKWVTFVNETTWFETRTAHGAKKLFEGRDVTNAHSWRNEFGTVFTF
jgi:hypothetical protein